MLYVLPQLKRSCTLGALKPFGQALALSVRKLTKSSAIHAPRRCSPVSYPMLWHSRDKHLLRGAIEVIGPKALKHRRLWLKRNTES